MKGEAMSELISRLINALFGAIFAGTAADAAIPNADTTVANFFGFLLGLLFPG
jgi:hypothetical protein